MTFFNLGLILTGLLLFLGGLGVEKFFIQVAGLFSAVYLLSAVFLQEGKIKLPEGLFAYLIFLVLLSFSFIWSTEKKVALEYLTLFLGGGFFWISFYNLGGKFKDGLIKAIIVLGLVFAFLYVFYLATGSKWAFNWSLVVPATSYHHHLGDFWAIVLVVVFFLLIEKPTILHTFLVAAGLLILGDSQSRSSYVALMAGILYVFVNRKLKKKTRNIYYLFMALGLFLFVFTGFFKPTLYSRPYFVQGIVGFFRNPLGVGMGNFGEISADTANHIWGMNQYSTMTHNLVLEVLAGMGLLGLPFVYWLVASAGDVWKNRKKGDLVSQAAFVALSVNLFFDTTYYIPTMLWLWFILLGMSQARSD